MPLGNDQQSWVLTSDGTTLHNGEVISRPKVKPEEGSIVVSKVRSHVSLKCIDTLVIRKYNNIIFVVVTHYEVHQFVV